MATPALDLGPNQARQGRVRGQRNDPGPNPSGLYMCGCGQPSSLATKTKRRLGNIRGLPVRFVRGHQAELERRQGGSIRAS
jgi:hypothetical protein